MTTDQPDADPRNALVQALVYATMPDGSPISSRVKAETILSQLGFTDCPSTLAQLIAVGVSEKARFAKRRWTREEAARRNPAVPLRALLDRG
ncbi:hypothetical protein MCBMB27_00742 [Methylobacterium phyllosphaerae]|uniref:Uncharacterized protein n=1 Tax=Methylobacterium phyllosphaerae TaxID=418223 RepID=A0AAE8HUY7_9HYPH|nr:hypothetical protein [Methylobacterium phyllosphaerae]APT30033.1 hypothetical protein MCBMB27_00742 [Methylobacterium phyllosphaerae]SFH32300.1 hypothetical protein SAMN05192567_12046 [Methylobacterium phyllosphaerae]